MIELILTIIAGVGVLLFLVSYLSYIIAAFKHHFVTGIISALPVLNIVTLPSLWDKGRGRFLIGFIGLVLAIGAWTLGAKKTVNNYLNNRNNSPPKAVISQDPNSSTIQPSKKEITTIPALSKPIDESNMLGLPSKALYSMQFDPIPVNQINTLQGRIVKVINFNNEEIEGRIKAINASSIIIEGKYENEIPIATIKQVMLMVKKAKP